MYIYITERFLKVVSEDNKKVKRKIPFTDRDREELQVVNYHESLH